MLGGAGDQRSTAMSNKSIATIATMGIVYWQEFVSRRRPRSTRRDRIAAEVVTTIQLACPQLPQFRMRPDKARHSGFGPRTEVAAIAQIDSECRTATFDRLQHL